MTIATWTNDRHAAACAVTDDVSQATDGALVDGLGLRIDWLIEAMPGEDKSGTRHAIGVILSELAKRHAA